MSWLSFGKGEIVEETEKIDLSSPWIEHARKIYALFGKDPDILVVYDSEGPEVKLYVKDAVKAEAVAELLPAEKQFGSVALKITVVPPNLGKKAAALALAFEDNPVLSRIVTIEGVSSNPITYVAFKNEVVQYFDDNLGDLNGLKSTLYENLANDVLDCGDGIFYCTEIDEDAKITWPED